MIALTPRIPAADVLTPDVPAAPEQVIPAAVTITPAAAQQIKRALARRQLSEPDTFLRVGVHGGGCSGLSYLMEPDTRFDHRDRTWVADGGIRVVVDARSLQFIDGMTIDYDMSNLMEGGYVYRNPNAARSCGCGTSFTPR